MVTTLKDYVLCYSPAFLLGVSAGLLLAVAFRGTIEAGKVSTVKVQSVAESQRKIRELLGDDKR